MEQVAAEICEAWWFFPSAAPQTRSWFNTEIPTAPLPIKKIKVSQYVSSHTVYINE